MALSGDVGEVRSSTDDALLPNMGISNQDPFQYFAWKICESETFQISPNEDFDYPLANHGNPIPSHYFHPNQVRVFVRLFGSSLTSFAYPASKWLTPSFGMWVMYRYVEKPTVLVPQVPDGFTHRTSLNPTKHSVYSFVRIDRFGWRGIFSVLHSLLLRVSRSLNTTHLYTRYCCRHTSQKLFPSPIFVWCV